MGINSRDEQVRRRQSSSRLHHFCERCTVLRSETDEVCSDCQATRPSDGWAPIEEAFDPFLGRVLDDRYLISKIEGHGSSSTIYRADSIASGSRFGISQFGISQFGISKPFAIKMIKLRQTERTATEEVRARIEREVRAVGMLRNPHIVRVYEILELDQDWIALVMDHIEGETLEDRVERQGPLSLDQAYALMRQVANALCEAHHVGMTHRDIKPANIMLELLPDGHDFAYVLDFGVVRLEGEAKLTYGFLGTPLFASPEQATGAPIDQRSDIYSLGATLFYMLTGHAPFESDRTLEVLEAHAKKTAPTLSQVCPERTFPPFIEELVAKMLAKAPAERPANLYEVLHALRALDDYSAPAYQQIEADATEHSSALTDPLGAETSRGQATMAFQNRPKTQLGVRHAVEVIPDTNEFDPEEFNREDFESDPFERDDLESKKLRERRDSSEVSSIRETNPHGFGRPQTGPVGQSAHRSGRKQEPKAGIAFARSVRQCGACSEGLIAFVDSHNEVWTLAGQTLTPIATPLSRVCSTSASEAGAFVGLADGSIQRVIGDHQGLEPLFADTSARPITALAATRSGHSLLAGTADGALYLGRFDPQSPHPPNKREQWLSLHANRGIAAVAMTPDGGVFAAASVDGFVRVATTDRPGTAVAKLSAGGLIADMAFCNEGHLLAVLLADGRIPVYQVLDGRPVSVLTPDCPTTRSIYFSRDNILYGVSTADGRISRWNLTTGRSAQAE